MDKLKALQYFIASAEELSFSGAARRLDVSVPTVTKLIGALERSLGMRLLVRSTHGLALTPSGQAYLEACSPLLRQLADVDASLARPGGRAERTLVIGAPGLMSRLLLIPALPQFRARRPGVQIDLRVIDHLTVTDAQTRNLDVLVALGWPGSQDVVQRRLGQSRLLVCASPAYWKRHGMPARPGDLRSHDCILVRTPEGTILDLWRHTRGDEQEEVAVKGTLVTESREFVVEAVSLGQGVGRFADLSVWPLIQAGILQPAMTDWDSPESPPYSALFRPEGRHDGDVQAFIEFLAELVADLEANCQRAIGARSPSARPSWYTPRRGRVSATRQAR